MTGKGFKRLGELLVESHFITEAQLEDAIKEQKKSGKKLGEVLVELGYISPDVLIQVLEFQLGYHM